MTKITALSISAAWFLALSLFFAMPAEVVAQSVPTPQAAPSQKSGNPEELAHEDLLASYLRVREQLVTAQQAIVTNRAEAEAAASAQSTAITERLESIKSTLASERERQQVQTQQAEAERQRQQEVNDRSNRNVLWVASAIGGVGVVAMLFTSLFQWRVINRMTEGTGLRPQLPAPEQQALLAGTNGAASGQTVALSNQRLMSSIERMERRMIEIEQTAAVQPSSVAPANASEASARRTLPVNNQAAKISVLLGKGQSLLRTDKVLEALACYNEILKLNVNHPEALVRKGAVLERLNQDAEAIQCYDRAIEVDQKMTIAYLHKGGLCNRLERYEEALKCYERALRAEEDTKQAIV